MSSKKKKNNKVSLSSNYPSLRNSFNTLAANIRFASIDNSVNTITIVSTVPNEGKTTVTSNLGLALAGTKKSVLLVDCDMRRRSLANTLNIHPKYGIYSVLVGRCSINQAIAQTGMPGLYFLDCEPNLTSPAEIISSNMFASLIDYLSDSFDYVIFDTPPLISFVDAAMIAALTDVTVLTIRQGVAKKSYISGALQQLDKAKANVLGSVLTFSTDAKASNYYYAYYNHEGKRVAKKEYNDTNNYAISEDVANRNLSSWYDYNYDGKASKRQKSMGEIKSSKDYSNNTQNNSNGKNPKHGAFADVTASFKPVE